MQQVVNGGIYRIDFTGCSDSEFIGQHPALILRTLKEQEMFIAIPLTTYSREKHEKIKRDGYCKRLKSTNSIARIDKVKIVHIAVIKNRWKDSNKILQVEHEELVNLNKEINKYFYLSTLKAEKEHTKYVDAYNTISEKIKECHQSNLSNDIINLSNKDEKFTMVIGKNNLYWISKSDLVEIIDFNICDKHYKLDFKDDFVIINYKKTVDKII